MPIKGELSKKVHKLCFQVNVLAGNFMAGYSCRDRGPALSKRVWRGDKARCVQKLVRPASVCVCCYRFIHTCAQQLWEIAESS